MFVGREDNDLNFLKGWNFKVFSLIYRRIKPIKKLLSILELSTEPLIYRMLYEFTDGLKTMWGVTYRAPSSTYAPAHI